MMEYSQEKMLVFQRDLVRKFRDRGDMTALEAEAWLEDRRTDGSSNALMLRLAALVAARRKRQRKTRIEDDPYVRADYARGLKLKEENPRMTWEQVAANIPVTWSTWKYWRRRLRTLR